VALTLGPAIVPVAGQAAPPAGAPAVGVTVAPDVGPAPEEVVALEDRGRRIALYFEAVREAEELARVTGQDLRPDRVLVVADRDGWRVIFLRNVAEGRASQGLKILAEVPFNPQVGEVGAIRTAIPPRSAPAVVASHGRALEVAEASAAGHPTARPPFESSIFREADGSFTVYLKSKGDDPTMARFGGDLQVRVASSGRQQQGVEALHGEPVTVSRAPRPAGAPTIHEHAPGDLPSPTDVAEILRDPSLAPHLVLTPRRMFRIDAEGKVLHLGPRPGPPARPAAGAPAPGSPGRS
jgi:hypothetical protein